ncbi:MAG: hypothetical protein KDI39_19225 [Pseudomonadales bacterium]|nr:hypothetical protein [Pseudomonadales bacterium]
MQYAQKNRETRLCVFEIQVAKPTYAMWRSGGIIDKLAAVGQVVVTKRL